MGMHVLENDVVKLTVAEHGAEMRSLIRKDSGAEYLWQADPTYWGRTAPVLFPFVGSVRNGQFKAKGQTWPMGQHGFARDMDFIPESRTEDSLTFLLRSTEETLARYPYAFELRITYRLTGAAVETIWQVKNPSDTEELPFSIGGHPAFNCPLEAGEKQTDYSFRFDTDGPLSSNQLQDGLVLNQFTPYELTNRELPITKQLFDVDTIMIEQQNVKLVQLCDPSGKARVSVTTEVPLFALWSPTGKGAPFVCIEPWYGRCDAADFDGDLTQRAYGNLCAPGETWQGGFTITVE